MPELKKCPEKVSTHRGYDIWKHGETSYEVTHHGFHVTRMGAIWDCIAYIDELLSA